MTISRRGARPNPPGKFAPRPTFTGTIDSGFNAAVQNAISESTEILISKVQRAVPEATETMINASLATITEATEPILNVLLGVLNEPNPVYYKLDFDVVNIDSSDNPTIDSDGVRRFVSAIQNLSYSEYSDEELEDEIFTYPATSLDLKVETLNSNTTVYIIDIPSPSGIPSSRFYPPIFRFTVELSNIPDGEINSATNSLEYIIANNILSSSNEILTQIE